MQLGCKLHVWIAIVHLLVNDGNIGLVRQTTEPENFMDLTAFALSLHSWTEPCSVMNT